MNPQPRRILVRGVNWLGDAVMTTPALLRLREKFPAAHIALLTPEKIKDLWNDHPAVNETISIAAGEGVLSVARKLRAGNFDLALVLPKSSRTALEVWLAGIPRRVGCVRPWLYFMLTTHVSLHRDAVKMRKRSRGEIKNLIRSQFSPTQSSKIETRNFSSHQIHEYLHLAAALGANPESLPPKLFVTPDELDAVRKKFGLEKISNPIFGLNPGAEYGPAKRWPVERFIAAAREIQRRTNCAWILFGAKNDAPLTDEIESAIGNPQATVFNLAGKTVLRELMCLLKLCRVVLTNDTGPMHVAAALGTPVVVPFGSTSPALTGPISSDDVRHQILKSDAPCAPCFRRECPIDFRCMKGISVEQVVQVVLKTV